MDKAAAAAQAAVLLINVVGVAVQTVRAMFAQSGMTDAEINAAIDAVIEDAKKRMNDAKRAAGLD